MRRIAALIFCLLLASPLIALAVRAFPLNFDGVNATLAYALFDTSLLIAGTLIVTTLIALPLAALIVFTNIPYKFPLFVVCCLPLALPPYLTAFTWVEMADGLGFIQTAFRSVMGYKLRRDYWFPDIRSMGGAIFIFSLALYPYVFLTLYTAFMSQGRKLTDAAMTLGATPKQAFRRIALKLIKPAIVAGLIPVAFEALNDIGVAKVTGVQSLPLYIMNSWLEKNNIAFAALLSLFTIAVIAIILVKISPKPVKNHDNLRNVKPLFHLSKPQILAIYALALMPFLLGFVMPVGYLLSLSAEFSFNKGSLVILYTTLKTCFFVTVTSLGLVLLMHFLLKGLKFNKALGVITSLSYAIPGSILALAMMLVFTLPAIAIFGTFIALIIALAVRFMTFGYSQIASSEGKSRPLMNAARTLGATPLKAFYAIEWVTLKPFLMLSAVLIAIETVKELPLTLMLRPVGFETIALKLFEAAERSALNEMAFPALLLVVCCLIPVAHIIKKIYTNHM
jgi:iron(III) transport system permease protein